MYLVVEPLTRAFVFVEDDPRVDGYEGPVEHGVRLEESSTLNARSENSTAAVPCLGKSRDDPKHYKVFTCHKDCRESGFEPVASMYAKFQSWSDFQDD